MRPEMQRRIDAAANNPRSGTAAAAR
jgi:hypothetical protein